MSTKTDYADLTVTAMRKILSERNLPLNGVRDVLIARLVKDDKKPAAKVVKKPAPKPAPKKEVKKPAPVKKTPPKKAVKKPPVKKTPPKKKVAPKKKPEPEPEPEVSEDEQSSEAEEEEDVDEEEPDTDDEPEASDADEADADEEEEEEVAPEPSPPKKPKKEVKKVVNPEPPKKAKVPQDEFDDVDIPEKTYTITAKNLADLIHTIFSKATTKQPEKFQKLFSDLEGYATEVEDSGEVEKKAEAEPEPESAPEPIPVKEAVPAKIRTTFNDALGVYQSQDNYVYDPFTSSVYAKIVDGKVVPLIESDLGLFKVRFWHISIMNRGRFAFATQAEIKDLVAKSKGYAAKKDNAPKPAKKEEDDLHLTPLDEPESAPTPMKKSAKKPEPAPEPLPEPETDPESELLEEGGDDGETIEFGDEEPVLTEFAPEPDVVSQLEEEEKEMLVPHITIDEQTFAKYVRTQFGLPKDKQDDYVAISKTAGLSSSIGEQIMGQYYALSDKYPKVLANATLQARRIPAPHALPRPADPTAKPGTALAGPGTALALQRAGTGHTKATGAASLGGVVRAANTAPAGARATVPPPVKRLLK
jgi:hypothetical protein